MKRFTIYLLLILMVLTACKRREKENIEDVSQKTEGYATQIAFTAWVEPQFRHIFTMDSDGTILTALTSGNLNFDGPKWSPDGKRILYQASRLGSPVSEDIWLMNADGTEQFNLTNDFMYNTSPDWSPDGESIVFSSERDGNAEIYIINTDGSNRLRLTENDASDSHPTWSPDEQKIAFISNRGGIEQLYTINSDGSDLTHLVQSAEETSAPIWSPDSQSIAFGMGEAAWVVNTDGSMVRKVSDEIVVYMLGIKWSPSGKYLLFTGQGPFDTNNNVYLLDITNDELTRLTDDKFNYSGGSWSPDETRVVLNGGAYLAKYDLYIVNILSLEMTRLTSNESLDCCPDWQPLP